jgi:hypothetical protein
MNTQKKILVGVIWIALFLGFLSVNPAEVLGWSPDDVRINDSTENIREPSMVSTPDGVLYVVVPFFSIGTNTIRIYNSTNGGRTWAYWHGFAYVGVTSVLHPSIAYAEKDSDEKFLYVAVEVTSPTAKSVKVVRLNTVDKETEFFNVNDPIFDTSHDIYPEICTDFLDWGSLHFVYITWAQYAVDHYPVYFSRSLDFGDTWSPPDDITGGSENTSWEARPDIAYGTSNRDLFVVFEKPAWIGVSSKWETRNWVTQSDDYGGTWQAPVSLGSAYDNGMEYYPRVSAARGNNTVLVAYTRDFVNSGDLDIGYAYTTDGGTSWSTGWSLASSIYVEDGVELSRSDSQGNL